MDNTSKSSEVSQPNAFTKYVQTPNSLTRHPSLSQPPPPSNNDRSSSNSRPGDSVPSKNEQPHTTQPISTSSSQDASASSDKNTESPKTVQSDWEAARKQYDACENQEEKVKLKDNFKEAIFKRLKQLSEVVGNSKVADEIATIVDFLEILCPENPAINNFHEISKESRDAAMKLQDGLKHLAIGQHLLRQALASSSQQQSPLQQ